MKYKVTEKSKRPASSKEQCFYCGSLIGENHKQGCVLIIKKVLVKATIEYEIEVPSNWKRSNVEYSRNEGTWCSSNIIDELIKLSEDHCLCNKVVYKYVKDCGEEYLEE